jgi:hypothetical protein
LHVGPADSWVPHHFLEADGREPLLIQVSQVVKYVHQGQKFNRAARFQLLIGSLPGFAVFKRCT